MKINWRLIYQKIMSDRLLVFYIIAAWILEIILGYKIKGVWNIPMLMLVLVVFYAGVRTERIFIKGKI